MDNTELEIKNIVDLETKAWDMQDVELLLSIFHPDMVWPWPRTNKSHNPIDWEMELGRFDYDRWKNNFQLLFNTHTLVHNKRDIKKIVVSKEKNGAFAVVDIDTLWVDSNNKKKHWLGRVCKVYSKTNSQWKMIMHTGVLQY